MKRFYILSVLTVLSAIAYAQQPKQDSAVYNKKNDTIRIGSILIIKKGYISKKNRELNIHGDTTVKPKNSRISTNYGVLDFGFSNWDDQTNHGSAGSFLVSRPGYPPLSAADFKLRGGKSINVNIWFFMQKFSLVKNNVNLKYGLGLELNNYRFRSPVSFRENGTLPYSGGLQTNAPFIFRDSITFKKNKLAADYLTVPLMLNFATNHRPGKPALSMSFGVSAGYLYSQRNKQESDERGKDKNKGDYDMERFKLSYIGELGLGPVRFYGSYSPKSIFEKGLNMRPFTVGVRFSNW